MLYSIHHFPESFVCLYMTKRCSIKLNDEEAEIEVTESQLEEEVNMVEIEEN